jgi:hypothetical protein
MYAYICSSCVHHFLITDCRKLKLQGLASTDVTFIPNFVKICQVVQTVEKEEHTGSMVISQPKLLPFLNN